MTGISLSEGLSFKIYFTAYCDGVAIFTQGQLFDLVVINSLFVDLINNKLFIGTPSPLIIVEFSWYDGNYSIVDSTYGKNLEVVPGINVYKYVLFGPTELISEEIDKIYYSRTSSDLNDTLLVIKVSDPINFEQIVKNGNMT